MTMASSTARSQEDETRNARRNANRNPRWSMSMSLFKWAIWKETCDDHRGFCFAFQWPFRVSSSRERAVWKDWVIAGLFFKWAIEKRPVMTIEDFVLHSNDHFESRLLGNGLYKNTGSSQVSFQMANLKRDMNFKRLYSSQVSFQKANFKLVIWKETWDDHRLRKTVQLTMSKLLLLIIMNVVYIYIYIYMYIYMYIYIYVYIYITLQLYVCIYILQLYIYTPQPYVCICMYITAINISELLIIMIIARVRGHTRTHTHTRVRGQVIQWPLGCWSLWTSRTFTL